MRRYSPVFDIHQTGHGHALAVNGYPILVDLDQMKQSLRAEPGHGTD